METVSALLAFCETITGGFPTQRANDAEIWCFFDVSPDKLLNKHSTAGDLGHHVAHVTSCNAPYKIHGAAYES